MRPAALLLALVSTLRCSQVPPEPMQIDRGMLTVDNRTAHEWQKVEIWVNQYFRATAPALAAGGRLQVPLNAFVSGYAQRFDTKRLAVRDVRVTATQPDGTPVRLDRDFSKTGLEAIDVLGSQGRK